MSIVIEQLKYTYMAGTPLETIGLENVNCTIDKGEFIGILGHTGSGKSTLIQHINGLLKPTSGKILVNGLDTNKKENLIEIRKNVGLVFQYPEYQLFEETVLKDIAFGPMNLGFSQMESIEMAKFAMKQVGIDYMEYKDKSPFELSGGQKRRVAIAGVLAMKPEILILDEPTSGLDPYGSKQILKLAKELHTKDRTVIMVSHNMDDVAKLASRIIVMNMGKVVLDGSPEKVFQQVDLITSIGLNVPVAAKVADLMRKQGVDVPENVLSVKKLSEFVIEKLREKEHE